MSHGVDHIAVCQFSQSAIPQHVLDIGPSGKTPSIARSMPIYVSTSVAEGPPEEDGKSESGLDMVGISAGFCVGRLGICGRLFSELVTEQAAYTSTCSPV